MTYWVIFDKTVLNYCCALDKNDPDFDVNCDGDKSLSKSHISTPEWRFEKPRLYLSDEDSSIVYREEGDTEGKDILEQH